MFTMEKMKDSSVYKMVLLGVLCAVCGFFLSVVNSITAPIIAENALATVKDSLEIIYPGAEFTDVTDDYIAEDTTGHVNAIYTAGDEGVIFTLSGTGYSSSGLTFMVGFDSEGVISGFVPLESRGLSRPQLFPYSTLHAALCIAEYLKAFESSLAIATSHLSPDIVGPLKYAWPTSP